MEKVVTLPTKNFIKTAGDFRHVSVTPSLAKVFAKLSNKGVIRLNFSTIQKILLVQKSGLNIQRTKTIQTFLVKLDSLGHDYVRILLYNYI